MSIGQSFPDDFVWGVATASYQIEGAPEADGKGESIWDRFSRTPGKIRNGDSADVACDHYNLWRDDVAIMKQIGVNGYRFSISWPRVFPNGTGAMNPAGIGFYDRLVDALLEAGITPFPTLYHWDLPQALEDAGGWPNRSTAFAFADYAGAVVERLGDRVQHWVTINEPWCVAELGYRVGEHAPGRREPKAALDAAHHVLLAHGLGMEAARAAAPDVSIGIASNIDVKTPRSAHPADIRVAELEDAYRNRWYLDPVFLAQYPHDGVAARNWDQTSVLPGDLDAISAPMDFVGFNYYSRTVVQDESISDAERPQPLVEADLPRTTMGWEVYPDGLRDLLVRFSDAYELPPVYITESGVAFPDELVDGAVHDEGRRRYLEEHFAAAAEAQAAGVPLRGYFIWTLMDNFEWAMGYTPRFGLVWTDFDTQERIIKDSGYWLAETISGRSKPR
ncbi:MAG: GH1 family beta-glucosidase [Acidimicrobiia bacterium]|nr:GH1 family beta-glucosidase [Acidimicrobiia bacterium]